MKSKSIQRANFSHYTHDCVKSFIKMNFRLKVNVQCWEHIADMYLWYNPAILDPNTNKSFVQTKPPWSTIFGHKLKFVYQLVNFNFSNYKGTDAKNADPEVNQLRWLSTDELNAGFSTAGTPINFSDEVWDNLKNAIPTEWADTLLKGNQSFHNDEFFATVYLVVKLEMYIGIKMVHYIITNGMTMMRMQVMSCMTILSLPFIVGCQVKLTKKVTIPPSTNLKGLR